MEVNKLCTFHETTFVKSFLRAYNLLPYDFVTAKSSHASISSEIRVRVSTLKLLVSPIHFKFKPIYDAPC